MRPASSLLGAAVTAAVLAACGGGGSGERRSAESEWVANASGVIDQLRTDAVVASDGNSIRSARAALRDESRLYALLVVYGDFGGCRHMTGALGDAPAGFGSTAAVLARACVTLQRSATLFTRAASTSDAAALTAAARAVRAAGPFLDRANLELRSASQQHE